MQEQKFAYLIDVDQFLGRYHLYRRNETPSDAEEKWDMGRWETRHETRDDGMGDGRQ